MLRVFLLLPWLITSTSIYDDSIPLSVLDERIIKAMQDPQKGKGQDLLNDAYNYFNILDDIEILLKNKEPEGVQRIEALIKEGGPKFVNEPILVDDMYFYFKWEPSELNELRAAMASTKKVYKRLLKRLQKIKLKKKEFLNLNYSKEISDDASWSIND